MDFEDELIECVREYPVLYNNKEKKYKNLIIKESCWNKIGVKLNKTSRECKQKWRNIRDSYRKNKIKCQKSGSVATISKYNDERLQFIDEAYKYEDAISNVDSIMEDSENNCIQEVNKQFECPTIKTEVCYMDSPESELYAAIGEAGNTDETAPEKNTLKKSKKRKKKGVILEKFGESKEGQICDPAVHMFFNSMAEIVYNFPPKRIAEVRMKICNIVTATELDVLAGQTSRPRVVSSRHSGSSSAAQQDSFAFSAAQQRAQIAALARAVSSQYSDSSSSTTPD